MAHRALLILDACVLIDFWDADPSVLTLVVQNIGEVHIAENVLSEVRQVDRSAAMTAGLILVEPSLEVMAAAATRRRGLSFQDHLCLILARDRSWTCVSNDGRLRQACAEDGVSVLWGLELLAQLVEVGGLPAITGIELGKRMAAANPYLTEKVVRRFVDRLVRKAREQRRR